LPANLLIVNVAFAGKFAPAGGIRIFRDNLEWLCVLCVFAVNLHLYGWLLLRGLARLTGSLARCGRIAGLMACKH